ncbi:unnamed protein product [Nezara viridula]|uniref:Uncharacterized protein n=1 Tax=Nezara viridula TaxID=85310 RepID=A0A9P0H4F8_NEZVI|nr:unnamed protein product [Nezara viridula]
MTDGVPTPIDKEVIL